MAEPQTAALLTRYWRTRVVGTVDHVEVNERVNDDAGWTARYLFMTTLSAGIAVLGLLLSSPAVVIGAMLISPLMGPIIGLGFGLATLDARHIRRAAMALAAGSLFAVVFCAAVVLVSPLQNVTSEIAARTKPNLFDLLVALLSALAGTYATIRDRAGAIVGVAIATALMPPLATVGFGLATGNVAVFTGALLLFITNFVTIALTAAVMARLYGFGPTLSPRQTFFQSAAIITTFALLAVPLGFSLRRLAWEGIASASARSAISDVFGARARISQVDIDYSSEPLRVSAVVLTPRYRADADRAAAAALAKTLNRPVRVAIEQYRVGTGPGDADAASVQAASNSAANQVNAEIAAVTERLALVAGVGREAVFLDRDAHRARVAAAVLPGASLAAYHLLEMRVAQRAPGWTVELVPPAIEPPPVSFEGDAPDAAGQAAIVEAIWGARRLGLAVEVRGPEAQADVVVEALTRVGVSASRGGGGSTVTLAWVVPVVETGV